MALTNFFRTALGWHHFLIITLALPIILGLCRVICQGVLKRKPLEEETSTKGISSIKPETGILRSLSSIKKDFGSLGKSFNSRIFTFTKITNLFCRT